MIDHLLLNREKYYLQQLLLDDYVNLKLIGETVTRQKYQVAWVAIDGGGVQISKIDDSKLHNFDIPSGILNLASTGTITGIILSSENIPYYSVYFSHWIDNMGTGDGIYRTYIKATDIMNRYLLREDL